MFPFFKTLFLLLINASSMYALLTANTEWMYTYWELKGCKILFLCQKGFFTYVGSSPPPPGGGGNPL